jgi:hypothetical protein
MLRHGWCWQGLWAFESLSLAETALKLEEYRTEDPCEEGDYRFTLVTEVAGLLPKENMLRRVCSHD